jgi:ribonuclease VapC
LTQPARGSLVVDTSAAVTVIFGEPGCDELAVHLENALARLMPAAISVELGIVIEARLWPAGQDVVDRFLRDAKIDIVPVDADLAARTMSGWRRYGTGHHPAGLNFGDCLTYALAERTGHAVLCIGDDFAATGIAVIRPQPGALSSVATPVRSRVRPCADWRHRAARMPGRRSVLLCHARWAVAAFADKGLSWENGQQLTTVQVISGRAHPSVS